MHGDYSLRGNVRKQKAKARGADKARQSDVYHQRFIIIGEVHATGKQIGEQVVRSVSLKTTDAKTARQRAVRFVEEKIRQLAAAKQAPVPATPPSPAKSLDDHIADFQASTKAESRSPKHIKAIQQKLTRIATLANITSIDQIDDETIKSTIFGLVEKGEIGEQTAIYYRTHWRAFSNFLARTKRLQADPLVDMKRRTQPHVLQTLTRRAFNKKELTRLFKNAKSGDVAYGLTGEQRAVLYRVASETGFRVQELASITPSAITWGSDPKITIACTISKRRKRDTQEIKVSTAKALKRLCRGLAPGAKIWPGRWWERSTRMLRCDMAGIDQTTPEGVLTFHSLRHTFVTNAAKTGVELPKLLEFCRLSNPILLERYYHGSGGQRRAMVNQL
jgi:integrase